MYVRVCVCVCVCVLIYKTPQLQAGWDTRLFFKQGSGNFNTEFFFPKLVI